MSTDFPPPGDHPTDVMLLLLGDMTDESMVRDLVADLEHDRRPDDKFSPSLVTNAWVHLQQCSVCNARRGTLMGRVSDALVSVSAGDSWVASGLAGRVRHAAVALVASPGQEPVISTGVGSRSPERGRLLRSGASLGTAGTGILARRWTLAAAVAALVIGGGLVVGFRPSATQKGAIRSPITTTVASLNRSAANAAAESVPAGETKSGTTSVFADNALPATGVTGTAESKAAVGRAVAGTNDGAKADEESAIVAGAHTVPAVVAPAVPPSEVDLGAFLTANDALDRFATMVVTPSAASAVGPATNVAGQGKSSPATASPASAATSAGELGTANSCPAVVGDRRATATIAGRPVVIVRTAEATAAAAGNDIVVDAITCAVIGQRSSASTAFAPPATNSATSLPR